MIPLYLSHTLRGVWSFMTIKWTTGLVFAAHKFRNSPEIVSCKCKAKDDEIYVVV